MYRFFLQLREGEHSNSVMWVHDYHLMLLPKMLSDTEKEATQQRETSIIFFLHIPFPTSQIFRCRFRFFSFFFRHVRKKDFVGNFPFFMFYYPPVDGEK